MKDPSFATYAMDQPRVRQLWWRRPATFVAIGRALAAISSFVVADRFFRGESAYSLVTKAPLPKGVCVATAAN